MERRRATYEILREVVQGMNKTVAVKEGSSWVDNGDGTYTLATCSTLWLVLDKTVTISGSGYKVTAIVNNESVTVKGAAIPVATSFDLDLPFFWHGTIRFVNEELNTKAKDRDKFPMIFLHEPTTERHNYDTTKPVAMESECQLYFMKPADFNSWTIENHYSNAVAPMRNMCMEFVRTLRWFKGVDRTNTTEAMIEDRVKWGKAVMTGNMPDLISGELSGTSLKMTVAFEAKICCCN